MCAGNVDALDRIANVIPEGEYRTLMQQAVERLGRPAAMHMDWARQARLSMILTPAQYPMLHDVPAGTDATAKAKAARTSS
jgi:hypothetical protein